MRTPCYRTARRLTLGLAFVGQGVFGVCPCPGSCSGPLSACLDRAWRERAVRGWGRSRFAARRFLAWPGGVLSHAEVGGAGCRKVGGLGRADPRFTWR